MSFRQTKKNRKFKKIYFLVSIFDRDVKTVSKKQIKVTKEQKYQDRAVQKK